MIRKNKLRDETFDMEREDQELITEFAKKFKAKEEEGEKEGIELEKETTTHRLLKGLKIDGADERQIIATEGNLSTQKKYKKPKTQLLLCYCYAVGMLLLCC